MEHAHHYSPGSLASVILGNQFILHPSSLIPYDIREDPPEFSERLVGKMTVMVLSIGPTAVLQQHHGGEEVYVRAGCVLPRGVATGRWSRQHSSAKAVRKPAEAETHNEDDGLVMKEGFEVYIQEFEEVTSHEKIYPRVSFSLRTKRRGILGGSRAITEIVTLNYQGFWEGPSTSQVLHHTVPIPQLYKHAEELYLRVALAYKPVAAEMAHKGAAEAAMNQQVRSTYEAKAPMRAVTAEELAMAAGAASPRES